MYMPTLEASDTSTGNWIMSLFKSNEIT